MNLAVTLLQPLALWALAGLPVIIALYFMRLRRRSLTVSTHLFWQRVLGENSRRAFFQRIRHWLSLLLHLAIFLLIAGALARPLFEQAVHDAPATIIILDNRARMQAIEPDGRTRLDRALDYARSLARQASAARQFALLTLDAAPAVATPFSDDPNPLLDALSAIRPTDAAGDLDAALRLARSLMTGRGSTGIVLLSDRAPGDTAIAAPPIATARDNAGITRFAARGLPADPATSEVLIEVRNFGASPISTDLEIALDGRILEVRPLTLAPGATHSEILPGLTRPSRLGRGWLTARITAADALAADNTAHAVIPVPRALRVMLISAGNPFLEKLLTVNPAVKMQLLTPDAWQPALAEKFEIVIFDSVLPAGFVFPAPAGNFLFIHSAPFATARRVELPLISAVDTAHPITRGVNLQNTSITFATPLAPQPIAGWSFAAPLKSSDDAILITGTDGGSRIVALGFDLLESDLPLRVAFPLLIGNTLAWLAGDTADTPRAALAGERIALADGERAASEPLTAPPSKDTPPPALTGSLQPLRNGFYAVADGTATRWLAVNTFSAAESDLRGADGSLQHAMPATPAPALPPWQWLALAAFALFVAEWWLFHRRKTE